MLKNVNRIISILLIILTVIAPINVFPSAVTAHAATYDELNASEVFLKQKTSITCTLSSAAMLMRRTAIAAGYTYWKDITETSIKSDAWTDGIGLRWNIEAYNITVGHGYFSGDNNKIEILNLLEEYPQGIVIYNSKNEGQKHAVFLCDYDEEQDIFYVADPASNAPAGRIPLTESTIKGETQEDQINNITAYWYAKSPTIVCEDGVLSSSGSADAGNSGGTQDDYDPTFDVDAFEASQKNVNKYYVVTDESASGVSLRQYPSGKSSVFKTVSKGSILYIASSGQNNFGATWYKTDSGQYIFSSNVTAFDKYSSETVKFNNTAENVNALYSVSSDSAALRIEPAEGNNTVAAAEKGTKFYITHSGVNSVGAHWFRTEDGYYIKASQMKLVAGGKQDDADFSGEYSVVSGSYSCEPVEDEPGDTNSEPVRYKITASALNVRKSAVDGDIIGKLYADDIVEVTTVLSGWGKVSFGGSEGWISLSYAEKVTDEVTPIKVESIKLSDDVIMVGNEVVCTVSVSSDVPCMYKFSVYNDSGDVIHQNASFVAKNKFEYKPTNTGVYYFHVEILASDGRKLYTYSGNFTVYEKLQIGSVKSNIEDYCLTYESITWTVDTVSSSDSAVYKYSVYLDGKIVSEKESISHTFTYQPEKAGSYVLKVYLEDDFSSSEEITSDAVKVYSALQIEAINLSAASVVVGAETVCSVFASGGVGDYSYCFSVFKDDKVYKNGAFSASKENTCTFKEPGTYEILCTVKDSANSMVSAFSAEIVVIDAVMGDVNNDGEITAADSRLVLRYAARIGKLSENAMRVADVNNDGTVNAADARNILRCAANIEKLG